MQVRENGGWVSHSFDRVGGGAGRLLVSFPPVKVNLVDYLGYSVG